MLDKRCECNREVLDARGGGGGHLVTVSIHAANLSSHGCRGRMTTTAVMTFSAAEMKPHAIICASHGHTDGGVPYSPERSSFN